MEEMKQDRIEIKRDRMRPSAKATFGEIYVNGIKMGVTLELPHGRCIPSGAYNAHTHDSAKFARKVIMLENVPGRTYIEIHPGNRIGHTTGCILVGKSRHGNEIWHSGITLDSIINTLKTSTNIKVVVK